MNKSIFINFSCVVGLWLVLTYGCVPCRYDKFPGVVTVTDVQPTAGSKAKPDNPNATVVVSFGFTADNADAPKFVREEKPQPLVVTIRAARDKRIAVGGRYHALRHAETQGTCGPPAPFVLSDWERIP